MSSCRPLVVERDRLALHQVFHRDLADARRRALALRTTLLSVGTVITATLARLQISTTRRRTL
jgi:hypothetical protein